MIKIILATALVTTLAAPSHGNKRPYMDKPQVQRHANQITNYLKRTDPRVLREVLRQMKWAPVKPAKKRKRPKASSFNDWYFDMMYDFGGIPKVK